MELVTGFETTGVRLGEDINVTKAYEINDSLGIQYELIEKTNNLDWGNVIRFLGRETIVLEYERRALGSYYYRGTIGQGEERTAIVEKVGGIFAENTTSYHTKAGIKLEKYIFEITSVNGGGTLEGKWRVADEGND